ncbi:MAG: glycogen synthase GlgA [Acidobacteria bacterium]|nr:glycogen synthase GlgA [Acidobacteriota bacterium]
MVSSEATPFAKTGGLADVTGALPAALQEVGDQVAVVMPRYRQIDWHSTDSAFDNMVVYAGTTPYRVDIRTRVENGVRFYFVEAPYFFDRDGLYNVRNTDYHDNHKRFAVLSLAALGVAQTVFPCDILHCHDWQAALTPVYLADQQHANPALSGVKTVMTIHNLGYQGRFGRSAFPDLGLNDGWLNPDKLEFHGDVNLLKGGIVMADWITTVSPTYAREIQTAEGGFGLEGVLHSRASALSGILNGVDYAEWNPETDPLIPARYSANDLSGKRVCKRALLDEFHLPSDDLDRPLLGIVSRFAEQKGFDLISSIAGLIAEQDIQIVILGSGDWRYEKIFRDWHRWLPHKVGVHIGYNNALAHRIEAGADIFLMPSLYEPCGLNQIYSLKYGTVPVVRATGGLDDTIQEDTGFKFGWYSAGALYDTLRTALGAFRNHDSWVARMRRGMAKDYSWNASAREYSALYKRLLGQA